MKKLVVVLAVLALALVVGFAVPALDAAGGSGSCSITYAAPTWVPPGIPVRPVNFSWSGSYPYNPANQDLWIWSEVLDQTGAAHKYNAASGNAAPAFYAEKSYTAWGAVKAAVCAKGTGFCDPTVTLKLCSVAIPAP